MSRYTKMTLADVLANPSKFVKVEMNDYEKTAKMEVVADEENYVPRVHYTWTPEFFFTTRDPLEATAMKAAGLEMEFRDDKFRPAESYWSINVQLKDTTWHLWFMNFRRYGWSWTTTESGHSGYAPGHTYANGTAVSGLATTPAEVIRDSLVATWTELREREDLPGVFLCAEAEAVLKFLLDDAIAHVTEHARPSYNNGRAVSYLPEMSFKIPGRVETQPGRKAVYDYKLRDANKSLFGV